MSDYEKLHIFKNTNCVFKVKIFKQKWVLNSLLGVYQQNTEEQQGATYIVSAPERKIYVPKWEHWAQMG